MTTTRNTQPGQLRSGSVRIISRSWSDHDECSEDGFCGENANCTNTEGSYNCTCHKGFRTQIGVHFKADSVERCLGKPRLINLKHLIHCKLELQDINECIENDYNCSRNTKCVNVIGSYKCTCDDGFEPSTGAERIGHEGICEDRNECDLNKTICDMNAQCVNTEGSYNCFCNTGFGLKSGKANYTGNKGPCVGKSRSSSMLFISVVFQAVKGNYTCVYWEAKVGNGSWSERDCVLVQSNATHTMCSCKHLSSFAVLMSLYDIKDTFQLKLITWVGLSLSMLCLFFCILTFSLIRSIQSTRNTIHLHLCISLFIAHFIFLVGISATDNKTGCAVVAGLLQFFYLAALCWMCMEGVHLFRMVVLVFNNTIKRLYMMSGGYGIPALIVAISALSNAKGYGTERVCWLNLEDGFIWSFFGPVCIIIMVNVFFFLITVWKLAQKFSSLNPDLDKLRKIKAFTITAVAQLCVLGIMWIFGCFQFDDNTLAMSYLFTIFSSLQGALVFLMHCLLSKQVREEYVKIIERVCVPKKKYSEFSSNQSSNSKSQV
uniref:Uncharacterized protein n=1 Tax=Esox lucius TaxID=8010 RepID=A0A3P9AN08_ESOLU